MQNITLYFMSLQKPFSEYRHDSGFVFYKAIKYDESSFVIKLQLRLWQFSHWHDGNFYFIVIKVFIFHWSKFGQWSLYTKQCCARDQRIYALLVVTPLTFAHKVHFVVLVQFHTLQTSVCHYSCTRYFSIIYILYRYDNRCLYIWWI